MPARRHPDPATPTPRNLRARLASCIAEAERDLLALGCLPPLFTVTTAEGGDVAIAGDFSSPEAKHRSRDMARMLAIAEDASMAVHRSEAWLVVGDLPEGVSQGRSSRRMEVVVLVLEARVGRRLERLSCVREIRRGEDGRPRALEELDVAGGGRMDLGGPMAELLPPVRPTAEARLLARALLERMGCTVSR